ncbi:MAG: extracellular solute-binding protein [Actinobacteria bacterium]|nr:MAG: extracellular solute-binding protein [Actinomycetota bacterium]
MSDEIPVRPEDFEEVGLDPDALFDATMGRRDFLLNTAKLTAAAAAAGPFFLAAEQAQAARAASTGGDPIATTVINAATQNFKGTNLTRISEAGLQALEPKNFSGPLWKQMVGGNVSVVEAPFPQIFTKSVTEHIAKSGTLDVIDASPAWIPDFADRGVIMPVDDLVAKYKIGATFNDLHPLYRALAKYKGKTWGFFADGDVWNLYYRKDIFGNPKLQKAYKAKFKRPLRVPRTWDEFNETAAFITDQLAPKVYGAGEGRALGNPGNQFYFFQTFRAFGGHLYDPATMKALVNNPIGIKAMNSIMGELKASEPGINKLDFVSSWVLWLQGKTAMIYAWPPTGRISENYAQRDKAFAFLPKSKVVGKVGYALMPNRNGEHAGSFVQTVSADSKNAEAAFLYNAWITSPSVSLQVVMLPYTLRDPYRISHYKSAKYRSLWPGAKNYLISLAQAANYAVIDPIMTGSADYANAMDRGMTGIYAGKDVKSGLDGIAKEWDAITKRLGQDRIRASYAEFLKLPGATSKNTIAALGKAVKIT